MFLDGLPQSLNLLHKSHGLEEVNYILRSKFKFGTKRSNSSPRNDPVVTS